MDPTGLEARRSQKRAASEECISTAEVPCMGPGRLPERTARSQEQGGLSLRKRMYRDRQPGTGRASSSRRSTIPAGSWRGSSRRTPALPVRGGWCQRETRRSTRMVLIQFAGLSQQYPGPVCTLRAAE